MKRKPDTDGRVSRQVASGNDGPGNASGPGVNRPSEASPGNDWTDLQALRRKLKVLDRPLPGSLNQLFGMESKFLALAARPKAVSAQVMSDSDTLQQYLRTFPFSEEELMKEAESLRQRNAGKPGEVFRAAGSSKVYPEDRRLSKMAVSADAKLPASGSRSNVLKNSATSSTSSGKGSQASHEEINTAKMPVCDLSKPGFMRRWIDEILFADTKYNESSRKNAHSIDKSKDGVSGNAGPPGSIKRNADRSRNSPDNESMGGNSRRSTLAGGIKSSKKVNANAAASEARQPASPVSGENVIPIAESPGPVKRENSSADNFTASAQFPASEFSGIALLRQLVQAEKLTVSNHSAGRTIAELSANRIVKGTAAGDLANDAARHKRDGSPAPFSPSVRGRAESGTDSAHVAARADPDNIISQDESDRIATLVNDALVEQAIRNGVDLS